jgi:phosphomethylpyrimidine synthase
MDLYNILKPFEQEVTNLDVLNERISKNRVVVLNGKNMSVLVGEGLSLKINTSVGTNTQEGFKLEQEKIKAIKNHSVQPDLMMDLSTKKTLEPLYNVIACEIGCPVGTIPYYTCFSPRYGINRAELLETIEEQAESGISFMTLHLSANFHLAEQALARKIPIISRGGSLLLRDMKLNNRQENIVLDCFNEIVSICKKHQVVINIGTTFRPSTLSDALDTVNIQELETQNALCKALINQGIHVQMEGIGHIPFLSIQKYVRLLRKDSYIPFMPLGPIVSDRTQGQDHITAAIGASYMAALGGADIINAVTREEHTGGLPSIHSILEAIDTANTVVTIVNDTRFPKLSEFSQTEYHNCMGEPEKTGCSRCGQECPFIWNDDITSQVNTEVNTEASHAQGIER